MDATNNCLRYSYMSDLRIQLLSILMKHCRQFFWRKLTVVGKVEGEASSVLGLARSVRGQWVVS